MRWLMTWLMLSSTIILAQTPTQPDGPTPLSSLERIQAALNDVSSQPSPTVAPVVPVPPANFAGAGALYNPSGTPRVTGWATWAKLVDAKSESYFFTTEDAFVQGLKPFAITTSVRVGLATKIKEIGPVKVFGIVDGGGATSGATSGAAASGGGIATIKVKGAYYLMLGYRAIMLQGQAGTPKLYEIGLGKAW